MSLRTVTAVTPLDPGFLEITWDDGVCLEVDITDWLKGRPILEMLQVPEVFRDIQIVEGGFGVEWANGVDFCADALRLRADAQTTPDQKVDA